MVRRVELRRIDEEGLATLLTVAVADAAPEEVMPPVTGPPGWTTERREAFLAWHRARRPGLGGSLGESTYAVLHDREVVGSARLARTDRRDVLETGLWLARAQRGRGIGTAALRALLREAARAGARAVVADTTTHNTAALTALRRNGAVLTTGTDAGSGTDTGTSSGTDTGSDRDSGRDAANDGGNDSGGPGEKTGERNGAVHAELPLRRTG
ncbi:Protein N-acetyltransferase, RimJ/RimL family [Streptomyces zhaozhouensis]|uniref:Protein N-acetyltransferase, RimJ/RimL family n=1 Tax=Streptomyces zhaozhouensis TaxID=1300267 RepID=A0A286E0J0_9ACTN|nr:GNAT family protein [Streptomyces zhaozhouensis]SOD64412.1 Protein N-acetyltransferase, RimJ/RimL family [Streptomyces zhaozhouensis]